MSFEETLKEKQEFILKIADNQINKIALKLFSRVILQTPVDTGAARANWQVSRGEPITSITERSQTEALRDLPKKRNYGGLKEPTFLTNNLPYIQRLEFEGWSDQAPEGMVRINVLRSKLELDAK